MKQALRVRKDQKRGEPREEGPVQPQVYIVIMYGILPNKSILQNK